MANEFGGDDGDNQNHQEENNDKGQGFNQGTPSDKGGNGTGEVNITPEELRELRNRDTNAQQHIPRLESENESYRNKIAELENALASATTLEEVMNRMDSSGNNSAENNNNQQSFDPDSLAEQVEQRLQMKARKQVEDENWDQVVTKLTEKYGEWSKADMEITAKAEQLNMSTQEATALAKRSPTAFEKLFLDDKSSGTPSGARAAGAGQTPNYNPGANQEQQRTREYYNQLRKDNPRKYWSVETQEQLRRDLYSE